MNATPSLLVALMISVPLGACGGAKDTSTPVQTQEQPSESQAAPGEASESTHAHDEESLGTVIIGTDTIELAQGHGPLVAGEEAHLVVKLPYSDGGSTVVRAWIGGEDRTLSYVGKGEYAASHDDYDIHATAPDPLPEPCHWWIEIEKPDGDKQVGSAEPLRE